MSEMAERLVGMLGADAQFDGLVDAVLARLRAMLLVPDGAHVHDAKVAREFAAARERLLRFRPEYTALQARHLVGHLGEEHLADALAVLGDARTARLFGALQAGAAGAAVDVQALARRMQDAVLLGEPSP